ncbi:PRDM8 protein, partial [Rostratula benghalensis]|nr:PRDM8 protein [Rostratula benghalensis]
MEDAGVQRGIWDGDAKTVQQCLTDIFTSVYTTCDIPENAIFGPCVLSHTSLYDSIAFIALKSTDKRTVPYIFRVDTSAANGSSEGLMWLRLVQSAREREEQNLEAYIKSGQLFYRSLRRIAKDEELLVWYGKELTELLLLSPARAPARTNGGCPTSPAPRDPGVEGGGGAGIPGPRWWWGAERRWDSRASFPSSPGGALSPALSDRCPRLCVSPPGCACPRPQARRPSPAPSAASASSSSCPSPRTSGSAAPRGCTAPTPAPPPRPPAARTAPARTRRPASTASPAGRSTTPSPGPTGAAPPPAPSPPRTSTTWRGSWKTPAAATAGPRGGRLPPRVAPRGRPARPNGGTPRKKNGARGLRHGAASRQSGRGYPPPPRRSRCAPHSSNTGRLDPTAAWRRAAASSRPPARRRGRPSAAPSPARGSAFTSVPQLGGGGPGGPGGGAEERKSAFSQPARSFPHVSPLVLGQKLGGLGEPCPDGAAAPARLYAAEALAVKLPGGGEAAGGGGGGGGAGGGGLPKQSPFLYATAFWPKSSTAAAVAAAAAGPLQLQLPSALTLLPPSFTSLCLPAQNWCAKCNASFRMTSDLVYHMRSHHKKEYALEPLVKRRREEKLKCPICNESFRERHHLSRHMTSHN